MDSSVITIVFILAFLVIFITSGNDGKARKNKKSPPPHPWRRPPAPPSPPRPYRLEKGGRNPPPPIGYTKPAPTPAPPVICTGYQPHCCCGKCNRK